MSLTIGSLCTGYGGLDAAVSQHYGARTVWLSEVDKNANQILTHHYPDVPNLGDLTVTGISHVAQLKALGNGVVPQQALLALQHLTNGDH